MGEEGFSSDSSLLYHRGIPSAISSSEVWEIGDLSTTPNHPLKPRHLRLHELDFAARSQSEARTSISGAARSQSEARTSISGAARSQSDARTSISGAGVDPVTGRRLILGNNDVRISYVVASAASPYYRNALGDECVFVESGVGVVETVFGNVAYRSGDYVMIPRATTHRWVPNQPSRLYPIEANSHIAPPKRYLSRYGQLLEHAPFCERDLHGPVEPLVETGSEVEVLVKHRGSTGISGIVGTKVTYATHPLDVVGWDGCLYPYTFNLEDYMPITGKVHQPPPVHQVFEGHNFVICNFLPRKVDYAEGAIPVPYYHSNVDSDEVMFYVGGDYEARRGSGIDIGSVSLHPGGHPHGPAPGAMESRIGVEYFDESAVMVDTFAALELGEAGRECEDPAYAWTWLARGES